MYFPGPSGGLEKRKDCHPSPKEVHHLLKAINKPRQQE